MLSQELRFLIKPFEAATRVIWFATLMALLILLFVAYSLPVREMPNASAMPVNLFYIVAVIWTCASLYLRRFALSEERTRLLLSGKVDLNSLAGNPRRGRTVEERLTKLKALPPAEQRLMVVANAYLHVTLICSAMNEAVAILGFVIAITKAGPEMMLPFWLTALLLNVFMFPRLSRFVEEAAVNPRFAGAPPSTRPMA